MALSWLPTVIALAIAFALLGTARCICTFYNHGVHSRSPIDLFRRAIVEQTIQM